MTDTTTPSGVNLMDSTVKIFDAVSMDELGDILKVAGYRVTAVEQNGLVQLMSASQGIGFALRPGNALEHAGAASAATYLDYTFSCALQVQGDLPTDLAPSWNRTKRFGRLAVHGSFLVLEMDVVVAGGVSVRHLRSMVELWDRLIQELLLHVRNRPTMAAAEQGGKATTEMMGAANAGRSSTAGTNAAPKGTAP